MSNTAFIIKAILDLFLALSLFNVAKYIEGREPESRVVIISRALGYILLGFSAYEFFVILQNALH